MKRNEKTLKDYLERVKTCFDNEFTVAEKFFCSGNTNGTISVYEIYSEKHPEDEDYADAYIDDDYNFISQECEEIEDEYLNYFMNEIEELESQYSDEEFNRILDDYYNTRSSK